jgi:hypothetical protein
LSKKNNTDNKLKCIGNCQKTKDKDKGFYNSKSDMYSGLGKIPICKECLKSMVDYSDIESVYKVLQQIDVKFDFVYWKKAEESDLETFGRYITMANSLPQFEGMSWKDSVFKKEKASESVESKNDKDEDEFQITSDLIKKWGRNFQSDDYFKLEDFYNKMMISNKIESPQDETYLKKLSMISLKMDKELEEGNYAQVKQLGDLFSKYMADSKFRAMDQTDASKTGGLRTFSQIYAEVEKDEFIPPWEEYRKVKGLEQDIVDKTIMYILNYTLKLSKVSQMTEPPSDTPKIEESEFDE